MIIFSFIFSVCTRWFFWVGI